MAPNGGDSHELWVRIREVEAVCNTCKGAELPNRIGALESRVSEIRTELKLMAFKIGLIVGLIGVAAQVAIAIVQADAIRKILGP